MNLESVLSIKNEKKDKHANGENRWLFIIYLDRFRLVEGFNKANTLSMQR